MGWLDAREVNPRGPEPRFRAVLSIFSNTENGEPDGKEAASLIAAAWNRFCLCRHRLHGATPVHLSKMQKVKQQRFFFFFAP